MPDIHALPAYARILDTIHDAVMVTGLISVDSHGPFIIYVNEAFTHMTGYAASEIIGKSPRMLQGPKTDRKELGRLRDAISSCQNVHAELINYKKDGTEFIVNLEIIPIYNEKGDCTHHVSLQRDITGLKRAQQDLERTNQVLSQKLLNYTQELEWKNAELEQINAELASFNHIAGHDLQEPLRKIKAFAKLIADAETLSGKSKDYFDRIISSADRMRILIQSLLELSTIQSSEANFECCDLNILVGEAVLFLQSAIAQTHAKIEFGTLCSVLGDRSQLTQLFIHIIDNSIKYARSGIAPSLRIHSSIVQLNEQSYCEIVCDDNGIGFEPQYRNKIFEPFQRLHSRHEYAGTGMGLTLCKKIVSRHQGKLFAESKPGIGSSFIVCLPAMMPASQIS